MTENMQITLAGRDFVLHYVSMGLLKRHAALPNKFSVDMINRLLFDADTWRKVKDVAAFNPWAIRRTCGIVFPLELMGFDPVSIVRSDGYPLRTKALGFSMVSTAGLMCPSVSVEPEHAQGSFIQSRPTCIASYIDTNNKIFPVFRKWCGMQYKVMHENMVAYQSVLFTLDSCTTWLQVKKLYPELAQFIHTLRRDQYSPLPDLTVRDAKRAQNPDPSVAKTIDALKPVAVPVLLSTSYLKDAKWGLNTEPCWDPYYTRAMYEMDGYMDPQTGRKMPFPVIGM